MILIDVKIPPLASKQLEPLLTLITDIKPHPDNYKTHPQEQIKSLRASVKAFGWTAPIKVNLEGVIVAGHGMYQLAIEDGYTHVPAIIEALDERLSKAYLVADNETQRRGITEQDQLNSLLEEISEIPDFDIEAVGFSSDDIDSFLNVEPKEVIEDEFNPDGEVETRCKEGDLWQLGKHRLLCGDSTEKQDFDRLMNGNKASVCFTSPPYNGNTHIWYGPGEDSKLYKNNEMDDKTEEEYITFLQTVLKNIKHNTDGFCFWNINYNTNSRNAFIKCLFPFLDNLWETICWKKTGIPIASGLSRVWEPIFCFKFGKSKDHIGEKWDGESNYWDISNNGSQHADHKACFPIELPSKGITLASNKNDIILEPFCGSGSTLIACEQLNRSCYGIELDPHYCDVVLQRWEQFTGKTAVKL